MGKQFTEFIRNTIHVAIRDKQKRQMIGIVVAVVAMIGTLGTGIYSYYQLHTIRPQYLLQHDKISSLKETVSKRDQQLRYLSGRINELQSRLLTLASLEAKIRKLAGAKPSAHPSFSGIGGSETDAMDPVDTTAKDQEDLEKYLNSQINRLNKVASQGVGNMQGLLEALKAERQILAVIPSIDPVDGGTITSGFGYRKSPFTGKREFHAGVDIADQWGSPVKATANGVVKYAGRDGGLGNAVIINHGHGIQTRYGHLSKIRVKSGQKVKKGQLIGAVGTTGMSTGPHLHYEVRFNGIPMNAANYLPEYLAKN